MWGDEDLSAVPRVRAVGDDRALEKVRVVDRGAANRLLAVATVTAA